MDPRKIVFSLAIFTALALVSYSDIQGLREDTQGAIEILLKMGRIKDSRERILAVKAFLDANPAGSRDPAFLHPVLELTLQAGDYRAFFDLARERHQLLLTGEASGKELLRVGLVSLARLLKEGGLVEKFAIPFEKPALRLLELAGRHPGIFPTEGAHSKTCEEAPAAIASAPPTLSPEARIEAWNSILADPTILDLARKTLAEIPPEKADLAELRRSLVNIRLREGDVFEKAFDHHGAMKCLDFALQLDPRNIDLWRKGVMWQCCATTVLRYLDLCPYSDRDQFLVTNRVRALEATRQKAKALEVERDFVRRFPQWASLFAEYQSFLASDTDFLKGKKGEVSIVVQDIPPGETVYLLPNWDKNMRLADTPVLPAIPLMNGASLALELTWPKEGAFHFSLFSDPPLSKILFQQNIEPRAGAFRLVLSLARFQPIEVPRPIFTQSPVGPNPATASSPPRLCVIILDSLCWNLLKPLMARGQMPFFHFLHQKGFTATFHSEIPHTSVALALLTSSKLKTFLFRDFFLNHLRDIAFLFNRQNDLFSNLVANYRQFRGDEGILTDTLAARGLTCLDMVYADAYRDIRTQGIEKVDMGPGVPVVGDRYEKTQILLEDALKRSFLLKFGQFKARYASETPSFAMFYAPETDYMIHNFWTAHMKSLSGDAQAWLPGSDAVVRILARVDRAIGDFFQHSIRPVDTLVIISDHGAINYSRHGKDGLFVAHGPGQQPTSEGRTLSLAEFPQMVEDYFFEAQNTLRPKKFFFSP